MTRVAAIDCGTNTIKLLVCDLDTSVEHLREARMVRLGQDVDATGRLADAALARVFAAVDEYSDLIGRHDVEAIRFCATSAVRDAANAGDFLDGVQQRLGVRPEVLTGAEEARLGFAGATRGLADLPEPVLVVDIGGGSTECVLGSGGVVTAGHSLDIGSVRLTERHLRGDPPTSAEVEAAAATITAALDTLPDFGVDLGAARTVVAVSGTGLTVTAIALGLGSLDKDRLQGAEVGVGAVAEVAERLLRLTVEERTLLPAMHPGRADVIAAGGLILARVLARTPVHTLRTSVCDLLDGIAWSLG